MYFVDRDKIASILQFINKQILIFESESNWETPLQKAALERLAHSMIEAILDVGNAMIDGFIMREAGSYDDIIDVLLDEKVITKEMEEGYKQLILLRTELVANYTNIDHGKMEKVIFNHLNSLKLFAPHINDYLENNLGPVSAFKK